ncbi:hypothetical protein B1748_19135 [Paenibacillus sp. MY03]|nr:hypothetical protein B1748_19135 [Paenibacillus sp. MY03]
MSLNARGRLLKTVTILDVAKLVEASPATVSRVLSGSDYPVSEAMREKIKKAAKQLNYTPNLVGRQLKTNTSMTIGIIVPSISNPFYSEVVLGMEEIARQKGYHVLLCNSHQDIELEKNYFKTLLENQVRGVIISSISQETGVLTEYSEKGGCVISIDQAQENPTVFQVNYDYRRGGYMAVQHLLELGHRRIAYVTAPLDRPSRLGIYKGYQDAMREYEANVSEELVRVADKQEGRYYDGKYEFNNGKKLAKQLLELSPDKRPTAILACNDSTAMGVMYELREQGVRVPDDMSVMGFDNVDLSIMTAPPLTTIEHPKAEMGKFACNMLFQVLEGDAGNIQEIMLQPKLVLRQSTQSISLR